VARTFFSSEQFNFELQAALGGVVYGCGDVGELLATADRIVDGDADSWCREWIATARRVDAIAEQCAAAGHRLSARAAFLRASAYYAQALSAVDGTADPAALLLPTFRAHRRCFDAFCARLDPPADRLAIPYEGTTLPGYWFRPDASGRARPTLILNNGSDGPVTSLWPALGAGAVARGYNALVFDGPGQQSMLFERGVPFRHDWERVITPIVDVLLGRPEVDPARVALYGISQGGYWVPRALAFEHRLAAGIADPGVYDAFQPWWEALPGELRRLLDAGDRERFDQAMEEGMRAATPAQRQNWAWRAKPYGKQSAYDVFAEARKYTLEGVADRITTPLLITDPEGEQFWPGQSERLYRALPGPKRLVGFTAAEGADRHCEPLARSLVEQRCFDWLDETLGVDRAAASTPPAGT
jgi:dienelactone hydrolase